jgi:drebrin-like protein
VPSNYLEEIGDDGPGVAPAPAPVAHQPAPAAASTKGPTATALYDYEAGEDNELSFPEDAIITNLVST